MIQNIDNIWQWETQQKIFRKLLHCMSLPGDISDISQYLENASALVGVLATLLDRNVSWNDEDNLVNESERYFLRAPITSLETAKFVIKDAINPPQTNFLPCLGELIHPEKSATLILRGKELGIGSTLLQFSGCGVKDTRLVHLSGFHPEWFILRQTWVANFPLGIDILLVDFTKIMALPRTTKVDILRSEN
jgi:alpha-D-ribose 1-methylphosphonate 5-triphosphate synthase subunit PhnH